MWVWSLCIYWCDCWCCFLLNICCLYIDPLEGKPKIWKHINYCLSSAKAIPIQEVQKLLCVDAAASDAEYLCMWCLASHVDIFWEILFQNLWNKSARLKCTPVRGNAVMANGTRHQQKLQNFVEEFNCWY